MHPEHTLAPHVAARIDTSGGPDVCHPCAGWLNDHGYPQVWVNNKRWKAHRYVYFAHIGPVPRDWAIDHECHNRSDCDLRDACPHRQCCNVSHLIARPQREHARLGRTFAARELASLACKRGHPWTEETTRIENGKRQCRLCDRIRQRRRKSRFPDADPTIRLNTRGELNARARLTEAEVLWIRASAAAGQRQADIARALSVDRHLIGQVVRRTSWKHI